MNARHRTDRLSLGLRAAVVLASLAAVALLGGCTSTGTTTSSAPRATIPSPPQATAPTTISSAPPATVPTTQAGHRGSDTAIWTTFQLTTSPFNKSQPRIDNDYVVWDSYAPNHQHEIFLYDVMHQATWQLTDNLVQDQSPQVSRGHVLWLSYSYTGGTPPMNLELYDIGGGVTKTIARGIRQGTFEPALAVNLVVWQAGEGGDAAIYLYDIQTETTKRLTQPGDRGNVAGTDGRYVVWTEIPPGTGATEQTIVLYDASSGNTQTLPGAYALSGQPAIADGVVVWTTWETGRSAVYLHDIVAGTTKMIRSSSTPAQGARTDRGLVAWREGIEDVGHGPAIASQDGASQTTLPRKVTIQLYDAATGQTVQVADNVGFDSQPQVKDGLLVWEGRIGQDNRVFVYDTKTRETSQLPGGLQGIYPDSTSLGRVVWLAWNAGAFQIFLASRDAGSIVY
jgi:hypothetical protein